MLSKSHIGTSITIGLITVSIIDLNLYEFIPGIILGACFPDIDTAKSWVSQSIPFVDDKLRQMGILKHRGITHGLSGIVFAICLFLLIRNHFVLGFSLGYITHCIGDIICSTFKIKVNESNDKIIYNIFWMLNTALIIKLILL